MLVNKLRFFASSLLFAALASPIAANDTLVTLGAGGLVPVKSSEIVMESESLEVSVHGITVEYAFRNKSDHDIDATVAFPLPALDGASAYHEPMELPSKNPVNFVNFAVFVGGKVVAADAEVGAYHDGHDVTERLRSLGLPVSVVDPKFQSAVGRLTPAQRQQLESERLLAYDEVSHSLHGPSHRDYWGDWETRIRFFWAQHFPARSSTEVRQTYRPVIGGSYITTNSSGIDVIGKYCAGNDIVERVKEILKQHPTKDSSGGEVVLFDREIKYILTTANNWSGPIGNFRLTVVADSPEDIVLTCMPGLERHSPTRYELVRSNFRPDRDLDLLILQENKQQ